MENRRCPLCDAPLWSSELEDFCPECFGYMGEGEENHMVTLCDLCGVGTLETTIDAINPTEGVIIYTTECDNPRCGYYAKWRAYINE